MLVHQFPDINMVRSLRNDATNRVNEWRNIVLNIKCREVSRTGVESPYSLFLNRKGHSFCSVNRQQYRVETDHFLLTRPGEQYGLIVDNHEDTEIFNIHINKNFFDNWMYTLTSSHEKLLAEPNPTEDFAPILLTQLYRKDAVFNLLTDKLGALDKADNSGFELVLGQIIQYLLVSDLETRRKIAQLPALKPSVRNDIYCRLSLAKDIILSNYGAPLNLDLLSKEVALSKFHLLRLFKSFYGVSPYQYLTFARMEKAKMLLKTTTRTITEISDTLGFEYPNSFSKTFQKSYRIAPLQYRKANR